MASALGSPTPTPKDEKSGLSWTRPSLTTKKSSSHKVSFSGSSKGSNGYSSQSDNSRPPSPKHSQSLVSPLWSPLMDPPKPILKKDVPWLIIDRHSQSTQQYVLPFAKFSVLNRIVMAFQVLQQRLVHS
jgi:hypothetical protein